jgi:S-DNA-T family DNA segregation ATPase FtsK/SpoIIIE
MPQSAAAKKASKPSGPTWSKIEGGKSKQAASKSASTRTAAKPAAKAAPRRAAPRNSSARKPTPIRQARTSPPIEIPAHVRREMTALGLLVVAALFVLGLMAWLGGSQDSPVGVMGGVLAQLFGVAAWLIPLALAGGALLLFRARTSAEGLSPLVPIGLSVSLLGLMGFAHIFTSGQPAADAGQGGGYIGLALSTILSQYLTRAGAGVVLFAAMLSGFMLAFGLSLAQLVRGVGQPTIALGRFAGSGVSRLLKAQGASQTISRGPVRINGQQVIVDDAPQVPVEEDAPPVAPTVRLPDSHSTPTEVVNLLGQESLPAAQAVPKKLRPEPVINLPSSANNKASESTSPHEPIQSPLGYVWNVPSTNLLENVSEVKISQADLKAKIKIIEDAFQSFNVEAVVREVNTGPAVTQFAVEPGVGVRVNKITGLDRDLALALAAPGIRIEAPIPGQSRVGIEVPNPSLQVVGLRSILESDHFHGAKGRLKIALGRDTHGQPVVTDLAKLPHMLVAGSTGSGKSVFLNSMVIGFLLQFTPDDLRMLMIDPKRVELTSFNGIPHLLRPVVTDIRMDKEKQNQKSKTQSDRERPLTAVEALKWALWEMERRYKLFEKGQHDSGGMLKQFRNIEMYRDFVRDNPDVKMEHIPYIVIIIDELADLMLTAPEEVETSLCRLAQLARATGIHLVVATQRPSVDVVTGLIKANFPARAAFAVTSQVDSKVILDGSGAEKLLGRGDMLYNASDESKPVRIQGTFVSDKEADRVVNFWRKQLPSEEDLESNGVVAPLQPMQMPEWLNSSNPNEDSELLEQAIELVKKTTYVSTSMLQRKLRVGYNRAARLVEQMEEMGLIAPADSENRSRPREVLLGAPDTRAYPQSFSEIEDD